MTGYAETRFEGDHDEQQLPGACIDARTDDFRVHEVFELVNCDRGRQAIDCGKERDTEVTITMTVLEMMLPMTGRSPTMGISAIIVLTKGRLMPKDGRTTTR